MNEDKEINSNSKNDQLEYYRSADSEDKELTTNQGVKLTEDELSLTAGERGPTLIEDFHFREKMTHFDHERIPERVVHARGFAAHGEFQVYESMKPYTKAKFLQDPSIKTPVFVRFSTVVGSRGSMDTPRDARGFATKFYTEEGNFDLVANNIPVFFIQDGIKFPDVVHAIKPEPHNEMPQASAAHDTFWDWVSQNQETAHMVMWLMSDRAIPRSFRMMEGFGVHTFRFVNDEGKAHFIKFHWKPVLGTHSLVWDEAQKLGGKDPDYNRRDLWESINMGNYPEYELGVQILEEKDEFAFDFDILDATKIWPEEDVPVRIIGKMTLNRNVDNVFAETEQVAFHVGNVVSGIDFTNDPLLQTRLFSYTDTQLLRLGGPNFHEIPINRPVCPFHNNQRDGFHRQTINKGQVSYRNNSLANNSPHTVDEENGGFAHYQEKIDGRKIRARSKSFEDHFSQSKLFWNSMSDAEKQHIIDAFRFELGKVQHKPIQQKVVDMFAKVDYELANAIAEKIDVNVPSADVQSKVTKSSPALSQENTPKLPNTRKIAVIISEGFNGVEVKRIIENIQAAGIQVAILSDKLGPILADDNSQLASMHTFVTDSSVVFDAVYIAGGTKADKMFEKNAKMFMQEAFDHYKPIGVSNEGEQWFNQKQFPSKLGVIISTHQPEHFSKQFIDAVAAHRFWNRTIS
ncbi:MULTISPECIES: catalase [Oceanobacillus]|uniref:Catalase n=1 Tax=Oceanobacillus kimchii TaxID=746691 RepID=A0ABQ5TPP4_9BACI|nr:MULTISPECIES: catalase [Oceanobacillus]MBT2599556.1 catalase [Oceanobacillus sp. ISL-74]GLO67781.1 catalase-2 [Oceanobacillus kimchii]